MTETEDYDKTATPTAHKTTHQDGGSDEISVAAISGELADEQKSTWAKVSGKPAELSYLTGVTSGIQAQINAFIGLFEIDINGDAQPVTATVSDQYYELDANNDIMPQAA